MTCAQVAILLLGDQIALSWSVVMVSTKALSTLTTTVMPSMAMGTSMISMPWLAAVSTSLVVMQREASAKGMVPAMSCLMPAPDPFWATGILGCPDFSHLPAMATVTG